MENVNPGVYFLRNFRKLQEPHIIKSHSTKQKKMPSGVQAPSAGDCYRFVLAREEIDICMMGVKDQAELHENLLKLEQGPMTLEERARIKKIGDYLYGKPRN